jgi:ribosomal protein S12 methylthiotransferase
MQRAGEISAQRLAKRVGTTLRVLVDEVQDGVAIARSEGDAPEIDGVVRIQKVAGRDGRAKVQQGDFVDVQVIGADAYDLTARLAPAG